MSKVISFLMVTLFIVAPLANAKISINGTITSDYVFRGVSQTDSSPAVQAGVDYGHESGLYVGIWASNVDFGDDADAEVDYFIGYLGEVNDTFSYDISYTYYTYIGYSSSDDSNYGEFVFNGYIDAFTVNLAYTGDYANSGDAAQYIGGAYDIELPKEYVLTFQAGYSLGDAFDDIEYIDYSATLAKTIYDFDFSAAVINTDISNDDNADLRFVIGVSRSF